MNQGRLIRWGIIGPGTIAHEFAQDFRFVRNGTLQAVASRSLTRAKAFARQYDIPRALGCYKELCLDPSIDAIYIATPHNFHFENASDAIIGGKAVLCEKPLTVTPDQTRQLTDLARTKGNYLMEGMWTYFLPAVIKAKEWVAKGKIGTVQHIKSDFGYPVPFDASGRMYNPELAGGSLFDMGIYTIAMAWLFLREDPLNLSVISRQASTGVDNHVAIQFDYGNAIADLTSSFRCKLPNWTYIIGTEGYVGIPDFWRARECFLSQLEKCILHFKDDRKSNGFNFEIDAVNEDIISGKTESDAMPLQFSLKFQEHMQMVFKTFCMK